MKLTEIGWSLIPCGLNKKPVVRSWKPYQTNAPTIEQIQEWLDTLEPPSWAAVTGMVSGVVVLDFDGTKGQQTLKRVGLNPHVRSGSGGHHAYMNHPGWRVPTLNSKTKRELGIRRPGLNIRADGGYAVCLGRNKRGPYLWLRDPVPDPLNILPLDVKTFLGLTHTPVLLAAQACQRVASENSEGAASILIERALKQVPTGGRNNTGFWLACQLRDNGHSEGEAEMAMLEYVKRVPGVDQHGQAERYTAEEALASLKQAFRREPREPWKTTLATDAPRKLDRITNSSPAVDFFERLTVPREEIIEGILREKQLAALAGPFGVGKSPAIADIITHRVRGMPWCGRNVRPGPVIIVDLENERGAWSRNVRNIAHRLGVCCPKVPDEMEVYLLNDDPCEPPTRRLLDALSSKGFELRLKLLEDAMGRKSDALVVIDPVDVLFPIKKNDGRQVLALFRKLKQLLTQYSRAAIVLTFNLRKQDRRARRANLLSAPRDWLEEIAGSLDLCNRSDVRIGMDFEDEAEGVRVINGIRRNEEMRPLLVQPVTLNNNQESLAGFELVTVDGAGLRSVLTSRQLAYWRKLPCVWRFDEVADRLVPRASLSRIIHRVGSLGLDEKDGEYREFSVVMRMRRESEPVAPAQPSNTSRGWLGRLSRRGRLR